MKLFSPSAQHAVTLVEGHKYTSVVVLVDPISSGAVLAKELHTRGVPLICVWSDLCDDDMIKGLSRADMHVAYGSRVSRTI